MSADFHFGHHNIIQYCNRPFTDVEHMRQELTSRWNSKVSARDRVYVLGDFAFGTRDYIKRVLADLNGEKYLILGNHDRPLKKEGRALEAGFAWAGSNLSYQLGKHLVNLSHYPYAGAEFALDRFVDKRPKNNGSWLLHGHVHTAWKIKPEQRMINVGVDQWDYAPVSAEELEALIDSSK